MSFWVCGHHPALRMLVWHSYKIKVRGEDADDSKLNHADDSKLDYVPFACYRCQ